MRTAPCRFPRVLPYLALLRVGFSVPRTVTRRAVRSYRTFSPLPALARLGGMFSVALSMGSRPPGVTWHPVLWSPDFPQCLRTATVWPTPGAIIPLHGVSTRCRRETIPGQRETPGVSTADQKAD